MRVLDVSSNRIAHLEGLTGLTRLEDLWVGRTSRHQSAQRASARGKHPRPGEHVLNLGTRRLAQANDNLLESFEELEALRNHSELQTVYFMGNPLAEDPLYETKVLSIVTGLKQLDALPLEWVKDEILTRSSQQTRQRSGSAGDGRESEED